jgi:hypothetical protein
MRRPGSRATTTVPVPVLVGSADRPFKGDEKTFDPAGPDADLDYVVPKYQGFTLGEFVYRPSGPMAARGYRKVIAPPKMQNAGHYLTDVGFRREGDAMVRDLA